MKNSILFFTGFVCALLIGFFISQVFLLKEKIVHEQTIIREEIKTEEDYACFSGEISLVYVGEVRMIGEALFCGKDLHISSIYGPSLEAHGINFAPYEPKSTAGENK